MAETLISDVTNADQMPAAPLPLLSDQDVPVEAVPNPQPVEVAASEVTATPAEVIVDEPQSAIEPSLTWQQRMDEGEGDNWLDEVYGLNKADRDEVRGPAGEALSEEGIDPRNILDADAFGGATRFLERMIAPYKRIAEAAGDKKTWQDIRFANQEAGNALVTGVGKAAKGFIDLTGELAEVLEEVAPMGYVVWDEKGLRLEEKRPGEEFNAFTIPQFWTEPETELGQIGAGIVQFVGAMAATSMGTLGTIPYRAARYMSYGAVADSFFDPTEGNFSTMLMDLGIPRYEVLQFLGTPVGKDAEAAERLAQRLKNAFEGGLIGLPFDLAPLMFKGFKALKENPDMLPRAIEHLQTKADEMASFGAEAVTVAKQRWDEGKSPIPMGMSIEDVGKLTGGAQGKRVGTTGQYIGAPPGTASPQKLASIRRKMEKVAREGEPGRFWYERSGKAILDMVGGDVDEADKIAQAIAITSAGSTPVKHNFDYAMQAYAQHRAGEAILTGKFPAAMVPRLEEAFAKGGWGGRKTSTFYNNLMRHIDPSRAQGVTTDIWIMRAFGFKNADGTPYSGTPTAAQYDFVEREVTRISERLGWEPQQTQAAIWVAEKARDKGVDPAAMTFDYADAARDNLAQISWESIPSRTSGHLSEIFDAPYAQQVEYHAEVSRAFLDNAGTDLIAKELGIPSPGDFQAPG